MTPRESPRCAEAMSADRSLAGVERRAVLARVIPVIATACALVTSTGCQLPPHQTQQLAAEQNWNRVRAELKLGLANEQFEDGRVHEAVATLREAVALDPKNPTYQRVLAKCYLEQGVLTAASEAVDHAKRLGDTSAELAYTQGMIAERRSRAEDALRHYRKAAGLEPNSVDYLLAAAECLVTVGCAGEAKAFVDEQLRRLQGDGQLLLLRARISVLLGDLMSAAADFEAAGDCLTDAPWAAEEYGLLLARLGRYAEASAVLRPLVELADQTSEASVEAVPVSSSVLRALAICHARAGTPEQSRKLLEEHLRQSPDDARAWWLLAESLMRLGDWDGVQHCVERGERIAPETSHWKLLRAYLAWHGGDLATTAALLESILTDRPSDVLAHRFLGRVYERGNDFDRARGHYETALEIDPDDAWVRARLRDLPARK